MASDAGSFIYSADIPGSRAFVVGSRRQAGVGLVAPQSGR